MIKGSTKIFVLPYYRWFSGEPSNRSIENSLFTDLIKEVFDLSSQTYGSPRIAELIYQHKFTTIEEAKLAVFEYIEVWYNRKRLHSSLGYKTPKEMELEFYKIKSVA